MINDWRRFKQLETEQREEQCREMERLIKKLSMTCRSNLDEEEEQKKQKDLQEKISGKVVASSDVSVVLEVSLVIQEREEVGFASEKLCSAWQRGEPCHNSG